MHKISCIVLAWILFGCVDDQSVSIPPPKQVSVTGTAIVGPTSFAPSYDSTLGDFVFTHPTYNDLSKITVTVSEQGEKGETTLSLNLVEDHYSSELNLIQGRIYQFTAKAYIGGTLSFTGTSQQEASKDDVILFNLIPVENSIDPAVTQINQILHPSIIEQKKVSSLNFIVTGRSGEWLEYSVEGITGEITLDKGFIQIPESSGVVSVYVPYQAPAVLETTWLGYNVKISHTNNTVVSSGFSVRIEPVEDEIYTWININPSILKISAQRNGSSLNWQVKAEGTDDDAELKYIWSFEPIVGNSVFPIDDDSAVIMDAYHDSVIGIVNIDVIHKGKTRYSFPLLAGQFPEAETGDLDACDRLEEKTFYNTVTARNELLNNRIFWPDETTGEDQPILSIDYTSEIPQTIESISFSSGVIRIEHATPLTTILTVNKLTEWAFGRPSDTGNILGDSMGAWEWLGSVDILITEDVGEYNCLDNVVEFTTQGEAELLNVYWWKIVNGLTGSLMALFDPPSLGSSLEFETIGEAIYHPVIDSLKIGDKVFSAEE